MVLHELNNNVLLVSNYPSDVSYAWWLMNHFWVLLADEFQQRGGKAFLGYPKINGIPESIQKSQIECTEVSVSCTTFKEFFAILSFIRKNKIKTIYFTDQKYRSFRYLPFRIFGVKKIIIHDHTPGGRPPVRGIKGSIKTFMNMIPFITADAMLCISELMKNRNIQNGCVPEKRCFVVQNGIGAIDCYSNEKTDIRKRLDISFDDLVIITSGRAHFYKRFDFIIRVAHELKSLTDKNFKFLIVGDGPQLSELQDLVKKLQVEKEVHLLGYQKEVHKLLCASDIAIHAAMGEGFSLSILEYMSAGLPVLVPNLPSVKQAIENKKTGLVYPDGDAIMAAEYLKSLIDNPDLRIKMGRAAKYVVDSTYSLERCTREFKTAISEICQ